MSKTTKQTTESKPKSGPVTSLKKQYLKSNLLCKVTFRLPKDAAPGAGTASIVGEFNNWNMSEHQMKKLKNGDFTATVELPCNREFRFRYLIDSCRWENDWFADKYVPNDYGSDDSVVITNGNAGKLSN
ncbi:MAG: isoamylase early set domain-containing protein [Nitrospirae bacterium]|nr:isoamylase early set domain-containing protein [Nitrospirota bacterium]